MQNYRGSLVSTRFGTFFGTFHFGVFGTHKKRISPPCIKNAFVYEINQPFRHQLCLFRHQLCTFRHQNKNFCCEFSVDTIKEEKDHDRPIGLCRFIWQRSKHFNFLSAISIRRSSLTKKARGERVTCYDKLHSGRRKEKLLGF